MAPKKRKADAEYSSNLNTQREQKRLAARSNERRIYENLKRASRMQTTREVERLKSTNEYQAASELVRQQMIDTCKRQVIEKRLAFFNINFGPSNLD